MDQTGRRDGITQRRGWEDRFATRTRGDVGEGLGSILALSTATDLISFSGGCAGWRPSSDEP